MSEEYDDDRPGMMRVHIAHGDRVLRVQAMNRRPYHRGHHLAPLCNAAGEQVDVADVLDPEERHDRRWGIPPRPSQTPPDPALVGVVARLQAGGGLDG